MRIGHELQHEDNLWVNVKDHKAEMQVMLKKVSLGIFHIFLKCKVCFDASSDMGVWY